MEFRDMLLSLGHQSLREVSMPPAVKAGDEAALRFEARTLASREVPESPDTPLSIIAYFREVQIHLG